MMLKKMLALLLAAMLMLTMASCGKTEEAEGTLDDSPTIVSAHLGDKECRITMDKNYGGQETGVTCNIFVPLDEVEDLQAVPLTLKFGEDITLLEDNNCVVEHSGGEVSVDMTVERPYIVVGNENTGWSRLFQLLPEKTEAAS